VEFGAEIARIMAGEGNPCMVRINNANYTSLGAKYFSRSFLKCASSIAKLRGEVDVILAETDTCPQNRYSTGARSLHTHFTGSILEGANGAKHWITRLAAHEPNSGRAYRKILGKHHGFYQVLADLVPTLKWRGFCVPVASKPSYPLGEKMVQSADGTDHWSSCVLERMGLPFYFSDRAGGVACLEGDRDACFEDGEILEMLKGELVLSSDSAAHLIARGFGAYLGVSVRPWTGKTPTHECFSVGGNKCNVQVRTQELVPTSATTRTLSTVCHSVDKVHFEPLFPGVTVYENELGGRVTVFCGTPKADYNLTEAGLEEIFSTCDIVSLHTPLYDKTYHMIGNHLLSLLKKDALLVNTARGGLVDNDALVRHLKNKDFRAVIDVYEEEPPRADHPLFDCENAILIPHMGGPTVNLRAYMAEVLLKEASAYINGGGDLPHEITKEMKNRMSLK
jgi:hypothetical protein